MMTDSKTLTIYLESPPEEQLLTGMFAELIQQDLVRICMSWTQSSAIGVARSALMDHPTRQVAIVASNEAEPVDPDDDPERGRAIIESLLRSAAPRGTWHVAMAIPDPTTWVRLDPAFAAHWAEEEARVGKLSIHRVAALFTDWTDNHTFDRTVAAQADPEFAALNQFVEQCASVAADS